MEDYLNHHTNINYNLSNPGVIVGRASRTLIVGTQNNHIMRNENNVKREVHSDLPKFPVFSIPFPSNPNFSGRCDILRTLDEKIRSVAPTATSEEQHLRSCLVYGIAGVGKTQVALKYCYRYKASYDAIFWLQAESKGKLFHDALEMQRKLQLSKEENKDTIVETLQHWLQVTKNKWLLVFDNAECWGTLEPLIPRTAHGSVIITSQHDMFGDMTTSNIHLRPLNKFEGGALLAKHLGNHGHHTDDQNDINLLCDELGGLPLAIAQIAGYITQSKSSVTAVLAKFQKRSSMAKIFDGFTGVPALQYNRTLSNVWDVALQELDEPAQTVLQVLSMLDADGVPHSLLFGDHGCAQLLELKDSERAIATLATRQLVTISKNKGEKTYSTHRALQKSVQLRLDGNGKFQHIFQIACGLVRRKFPRQSPTQLPQNDKWNVCEQLSPHIMSLRNVYEASDKKDQLLSIEFAQLLGDVANYFWERNLTVTGLEACETAERICDGLTGKFLSERAEIYILGVGLREYHGISDREASRYRCEKSLALRQEYINNLPPANASKVDVENYANAWHNLSCILMEYGFYEEALQYQGLAISIRNTNGESNEIANAQSELYRSLCLTVLGKHSQALKVAESLEVMIEELPNEEKNMLSVALIQFQFHLAEVYFATGRVETALEKMQKVSELRGQYFGFKGATLDAYYMLGVMEWRRENIDEAEKYFRAALEHSRLEEWTEGVKPQQWTEEAEARTEFWLGRLLMRKECHPHATWNLKRANETKKRLWKPIESMSGRAVSDGEAFDYMVAFGSGRPEITYESVLQRRKTETDEVCSQLKRKLEDASVGKGSLQPGEVVQLMKLDNFPGKEGVVTHRRVVPWFGVIWLTAVSVSLVLWYVCSL